MTTNNFSTSILVDQSPEEVFNAINNVRGWWSEEIEGETNREGAVWNYHYQDVHRCKIKITSLVPGKKVAWKVLDNYFSFTKNKNEWIGNELLFNISREEGKTRLQFTQVGLVPGEECYDICEKAWTTYIRESLYKLITTGKGQPNSNENAQTEDEKNLATTSFTTTAFVDQGPAEVFAAVNNVRGWWQGEIEGITDQLNASFTYRMPGIHYSKQLVEELVEGEKIVWLVTDSELSFTADKHEWTGTRIIFEIKEINQKTQLRFTHEGLSPVFECYMDCANAWEKLVQESLVSLITTGKGTTVFD